MELWFYGVMPKKEICVVGQPAERKTAAVPSGAVNERDPPGLPKPRWVFFCAVAHGGELLPTLVFRRGVLFSGEQASLVNWWRIVAEHSTERGSSFHSLVRYDAGPGDCCPDC